ncbi:MAG: phosphatase PAP2 family protein [Chthoniobacterales bacterium]
MDQSLLLIINREWTNPFLDYVMAIASSAPLWVPLLVVAGIALFFFGGFRGRSLLITAALCLLVVDGIAVNFGKRLVNRPRPSDVLTEVREPDLARLPKNKPKFLALFSPLEITYSAPGVILPQGRSFPSGHAANNFAFATILALFYRRWGWLCFFPALIVGYSRIYVGAHWPSDILISCLLGSALSLLVITALQSLWKHLGTRYLPTLYAAHPDWIPA